MLVFIVCGVIALSVVVNHYGDKRKLAEARRSALLRAEEAKYARDLGIEVLNESGYAVEVEIEDNLVIINRIVGV